MEIELKELYKKEVMTNVNDENLLTLSKKMVTYDRKLANKISHWVKF